MDFWENIEVLKRPNKTLFLSKDRISEKINALTEIAHEGYPGLAEHLIEFLKDKNKEVREATCRAIIHLFKKINSKKAYYNALRHFNISESDIQFYEENFAGAEYTELLAISSLNRNGYTREQAVRKLAEANNPRALQFLIYRLADWVPQVRQAALTGIEKYKSSSYIDSLIENLPIVEWLQRIERVNLTTTYQNFIDFIITQNRDHVISNFKRYPDLLRVLLAKHMSASAPISSNEIKLFLNDKHFLVRSLAIVHFESLDQNETDQLLHDKSPGIRLQTLYKLKGRKDFDSILRYHLADESATVRYFARFTLQLSQTELAKFYDQNLQKEQQIIGSIGGLAELAAKQYSETVKRYLHNEKIKIRKSAFLALQQLDPASAYTFALANLDTPFVGLRNIGIRFLSSIPKQETLIRARKIYSNGGYELKRSMLSLFAKTGGWAIIADLMLATVDDNEIIRQTGKRYIEAWRVKATTLYSQASAEDMERVKIVLILTNEIHRRKQYFKINPLEELSFYFK